MTLRYLFIFFFFFCGEESSLRKSDGVFVMQHIFIYTQGISVYQVFFMKISPYVWGTIIDVTFTFLIIHFVAVFLLCI